MENLLFKNWLAVALSMLSAMFPAQFSADVLAHTNPAHAVAPVAENAAVRMIAEHPSRPTTGLNITSRSYTYTFSGVAAADGQTLINTPVILRITSDSNADIYQLTTDASGRYQLTVPISGKPSETLSWEISSVTPDLKRVGRAGHQILTDEHAVEMVIGQPFAAI